MVPEGESPAHKVIGPARHSTGPDRVSRAGRMGTDVADASTKLDEAGSRPRANQRRSERPTVGFFGTYQFTDASWRAVDPEMEPVGTAPWLWLDIHDSDFATVRYAPTGSGTGVAYLNVTPRIYFEDDGASEPADPAREAAGLAEWWAGRRPRFTEEGQAAKSEAIVGLLASDDEPEEAEPPDDADIFAELKACRFLLAMDLPLPDDLADLR